MQAEIADWARLRARLTLHGSACILEFADAAARQNALDQGASGLPVADRYLLLHRDDTSAKNAGAGARVVDYAARPSRCLTIDEDGQLSLSDKSSDLLTPALLGLWAQPQGEGMWLLTRRSVENAIKWGRTLKELLSFLQERQTGSLPPLLVEALRAWGGAASEVAMAEVIILQCHRPELLAALLASPSVAPHLMGKVGPDAVLVDPAGVESVKAVLEWAGAQVSARIGGHRT